MRVITVTGTDSTVFPVCCSPAGWACQSCSTLVGDGGAACPATGNPVPCCHLYQLQQQQQRAHQQQLPQRAVVQQAAAMAGGWAG